MSKRRQAQVPVKGLYLILNQNTRLPPEHDVLYTLTRWQVLYRLQKHLVRIILFLILDALEILFKKMNFEFILVS